MNSANRSNWKKSAKSHACNVFPTVWGAIVGCTGRGHAWRYSLRGTSHESIEYVCPTCQAVKDRLETLNHSDYQAALLALQADAGVANYRTAKARRVNGIPTLVRA